MNGHTTTRCGIETAISWEFGEHFVVLNCDPAQVRCAVSDRG